MLPGEHLITFYDKKCILVAEFSGQCLLAGLRVKARSHVMLYFWCSGGGCEKGTMLNGQVSSPMVRYLNCARVSAEEVAELANLATYVSFPADSIGFFFN